MKIIVLHSAQVQASRDLAESLSVDPLMEEETALASNGWTVTGKHSYATLVCPNFSAYPALVAIEDGGAMRVKSPVVDLADCESFALNADGGEPSATISKLDFLNRFTDAELATLKSLEATSADVGVFWEKFRAAEYISLNDDRTVASLTALEAAGLLGPGRALAISTP